MVRGTRGQGLRRRLDRGRSLDLPPRGVRDITEEERVGIADSAAAPMAFDARGRLRSHYRMGETYGPGVARGVRWNDPASASMAR